MIDCVLFRIQFAGQSTWHPGTLPHHFTGGTEITFLKISLGAFLFALSQSVDELDGFFMVHFGNEAFISCPIRCRHLTLPY
jgi:hypothetical protein